MGKPESKKLESKNQELQSQQEIVKVLMLATEECKTQCEFMVSDTKLLKPKMISILEENGCQALEKIHYRIIGKKVIATLTYADEYLVYRTFLNKNPLPLTKRQELILDKCRQIIKTQIKPGMTELDKEIIIHNYLVINNEYSHNIVSDEAYSVYGALILGKSVCDGYSKSYKLLMNMLGIWCERVKGIGSDSKGSEPHSWNLVRIGGQYYHVDVTWDSVSITKGKLEISSYRYFNLCDEEIKKDHEWKDGIYPRANKTDFSIYSKMGLTTVKKQQELNEYFNKCVNEGMEKIRLIAYGNLSVNEAFTHVKYRGKIKLSYYTVEKSDYTVYEINAMY